MKKLLLWAGLFVTTLAAANFAYWHLTDPEGLSRDKIAAFADQCEDMAIEFNAAHSEAVRARAYEQNLGVLKAHPLTGNAQCTQVRGRCEMGYSVGDDISSSWQAGTRFVDRSAFRCVFPVVLLGGSGGMRQVELLE